MPLYEFYCGPCHTIYTYRFRHVDTTSKPKCPVCGKEMTRQVSPFSCIIKGGAKDQEGGQTDPDELASAEREDLIARMAGRLDAMGADDADPADAVRVMREMAQAGGLQFSPEVNEAISRIEAGEDPEKIDEQFQEVFDCHDPFAEKQGEGTLTKENLSEWLRHLKPPKRDPVWHDFEEEQPKGEQ